MGIEDVEERRDDLEAGEASLDRFAGNEASKGERDRWRWLESGDMRFEAVSAGDIGRDIGVRSDLARIRLLRPVKGQN